MEERGRFSIGAKGDYGMAKWILTGSADRGVLEGGVVVICHLEGGWRGKSKEKSVSGSEEGTGCAGDCSAGMKGLITLSFVDNLVGPIHRWGEGW